MCIAAAIAGSAVVGGVISSNASKSAAQTQANAANNSTALQKAMYDQTRADQAPYRQSGYHALDTITAMQPQFTHEFNANDLNANLAPNYEFQKQQGNAAFNNAASVTGGLVGGNALKGLVDYNQNAAASAYQQAYNNYTSNQTNIFNRLSNIAGLGQTANANTGSAGAAYSGGIANSMNAAGAAQAAGIVGSANAITGGLNNIGNMYLANNLTGGKLFGGSAASYPSMPAPAMQG